MQKLNWLFSNEIFNVATKKYFIKGRWCTWFRYIYIALGHHRWVIGWYLEGMRD